MLGRKNKNYKVIEGQNAGRSGKESNGEEPPYYAFDRKRCLNGRCGVCWVVILGLGIGVGICCILIFAGVLGFDFQTDGNDTLYEEICSDCTDEPTSNPTLIPTLDPTPDPTVTPTAMPTLDPTTEPTANPSTEPTGKPTVVPTIAPTVDPTVQPTDAPTVEPTDAPTGEPTLEPSSDPTVPTNEPTSAPTEEPSLEPTADPTVPTNEPTTAPTVEPTSDPTSERRRMYLQEKTPNLFLILADDIGLDNADFGGPEVSKFLREAYTFKNLKYEFSFRSMMTGKMATTRASETNTFAEKLRLKDYKNYYYGNGISVDDMEFGKAIGRGYDFYGSNLTDDQLVKEVISNLQMRGDEMWSITVSFKNTGRRNDFIARSESTANYKNCSGYFNVNSINFDRKRGVSCQRSMGYDKKVGQVLQTLKSTELWKHTIVVLAIGGNLRNMFSLSGGALPSKYLRTSNADVHSFLDLVPTILAVAGFTDSELVALELDGFPVFGMSKHIARS